MTRLAWIVAGGSAAAALVAIVVVVVVIAGGDDSTPVEPSEAAPPGFEGDPSDLDAFRDCMADQGVEIPDEPGLLPEPTPELQAALEACREFMPGGAVIAPGGGEPPPG
jgi:hypothetical protein